MLGFGGVVRWAVSQRLEVILTSWEHEEIRRDDLEGAQVLIGHSEDLVGLVSLNKYLGKLLHLLGQQWPRECDDKVVIQVTLAILGYLLEVGLRGFHQVDSWEVRDALSGCIQVVVSKDIAAS